MRVKTRPFRMIEWLIVAVIMGILVLLSVPAKAEVVNLTYTPATTWTSSDPAYDGLPLVIRSSRLICNGVRVDGHPGAPGLFTPDLADGTYACYAVHTAVRLTGNTQCSTVDSTGDSNICVADPSNTKQFLVGDTIIIRVGSPTQLEVVMSPGSSP